MSSVTLPWVQKLSFKEQSVLFSGLRGPDTHHSPSIKAIVRWLRPVTQVNADPSTDYMRVEQLPAWKDVTKDLEFSTVHYFGHLLHAMQIIAIHHPDEDIGNQASRFYLNMADLLHLEPEPPERMAKRLGGSLSTV